MGYDVSNGAGAYVRFSGSGWDLALAVARHYGWEPAGIPKPSTWDERRDGPWEDEYWMNAGQEVTAADAANLAAALERALATADVVETILRVKGDLDEEVVRENPKWRDEIPAMTRQQAEGFRARLVELAGLARQGPFKVE